MKTFLLVFIPLFYINTVVAQTNKVSIEFEVNNKKQKLNNDFELFFIYSDSIQKTIIKPVIKNNSFIIPHFDSTKSIYIVFKFKKWILGLGNHNMTFNENMLWLIGIDKKPYSNPNDMIGDDAKNLKAISYIAFNPSEKAEGTRTRVLITDLKVYKNSCIKLIK